MCEPTTLTAISIASTVLSAGAGLYAQSAQSSAQAEYQNRLAIAQQRQADATAAAANKAYFAQVGDLQARRLESNASAGRKLEANARDAEAAKATAIVGAAEAGVAGVSVDALLADITGRQARFERDVTLSSEYELRDIDRRISAAQATAAGRISAIEPFVAKPIAQPDYLGAALRIGTGAASAADRYHGWSKKAFG